MTRRHDDQTFVNLVGVEYIPVEGIDIAEFHELPNGEGKPTAVLSMLQVGDPEDVLPRFVVRLKGRRATDELIVALIARSKAVWPD